jgi:lambda repressor-like predicted transcriptional regulator
LIIYPAQQQQQPATTRGRHLKISKRRLTALAPIITTTITARAKLTTTTMRIVSSAQPSSRQKKNNRAKVTASSKIVEFPNRNRKGGVKSQAKAKKRQHPIQVALRQQGRTMVWLARQSGVSETAIRNFMASRGMLLPANLAKVIGALGVSEGWIFGAGKEWATHLEATKFD